MVDYVNLLQRLFAINLHGGTKLGLENPNSINHYLGYPDQKYPIIHVAGTNGKGSVSLKIASSLQKSGYRVGLYTSPHLNTFRERIVVDGEPISEYDLGELLSLLFEIIDQEKIPATFFEIATCLAFKYFATQGIDFAVVETGLGGRLDATNIVTPILSIITSISLEHTEILGSTVEEIAGEKAGIIKHKVPVIIGPRVPFEVISSIAQKMEADCTQVQGTFTHYDDENSCIAKKALSFLSRDYRIDENAIVAGLKSIPPCRMQVFTKSMLKLNTDAVFPEAVVLDVAHNPDGLIRLFQALKINYPKHSFRLICGLSKTKDIYSCLDILKNNASFIHLVTAENGRGVPSEQLFKHLKEMGMSDKHVSHHQSIQDTIGYAIGKAAKSHEILVICGTFFIMHSAYQALGIETASDPIELNESR